MPLKHPHLSRLLTALLGTQLLLSGVPVSAQSPAVLVASAAASPAFTHPDATDCRRPIRTHEVPGQALESATVGDAGPVRPRARTGVARDEAVRKTAPMMAATAAPATERLGAPAVALAAPEPATVAAPKPQAGTSSAVTAGMVDDNADFGEYLAFRSRTQVPHQARDISERYLLEVRDAAGRGVSDAQVQVQSPAGATLWARTDTAGHAWLHPNAFDPAVAALYQVTVRHGEQTTHGLLRRGQKEAVALRLGGTRAAERARLDLVFLIDATGSMADEIHKLKTSLRSIAADAARLPSRPDLCFGLVAYRDRSDPFVVHSHDFTNDLNAFQKALDQLQADGGGDYPEAMCEALQATVHRLSWRGEGATRMVLLLADAPPQLGADRPRYDEAMLAALGKGIKIFSVGASGLDRQGEFIQRQLAQFTGGRFVFLTYERAGEPGSGPGRETVHDVHPYSVQTLDRLVVRLIRDELAPLSPNPA